MSDKSRYHKALDSTGRIMLHKGTRLGQALIFSIALGLLNIGRAEAKVVSPPIHACTGMDCAYLLERVNMFERDADGYCKGKWGDDAFVYRLFVIYPFCALPYDPTKVVFNGQFPTATNS